VIEEHARGAWRGRFRRHVAHLVGDEVQPLVGHEVALGDRDHRSVHAEHVDDLQVLLGLRLPALVRRDDEQHQTDRSDAREHRAHEPLVPGHVHESDLATRR
jgi:hypothetical protein